MVLAVFLTDESYITPLKDPTSNYEGELSFEFEISNDFELEHNRIYVINKYASQLRDFVLQPDVKSVWNDGVRWAPSSTKDNQGKPNMYYSLRDDGKIWIIFSRDLANSSNRSGYLEFNFYHNCVEKKILKDGEEVDYAEFEEGEEITFLIRTVFDEESPGGFNRLTDVIDDRLILAGDDWQERRESVRVYDQHGKEYPDFVEFSGDEFIYDEDGYASIDYKQVTFKGSEYIDEKIEKVDLHGKTFTMEIKAKIKESANYGEEIPNIADIDGLESNEVIVKKIPPKTPEVVKDVEGEEHLEVGHEKAYKYNVKTNVPTELGGYKDLTIADTLDKRLDVVKAKVLVDGKASDFKADIKGQTVTLKLDRKELDTIAGKEINVQITAKIKSGTDVEKVPNKATIQLNDDPKIDSNVVTVIPPKPTTPKVEKDVEGEDHLEVAHGKTYNYNVKTNIPKQLNGYKDLTLTDVLDNRLDVVGAKVLVDGKASDFEAKIDGQTVTLKLDRKQLDTIAGKEVNLQITAKIKSGTDIELIDNKATIQLNDNPDVDSNVVTVIPPTPTTPELVKDVEGEEHLEVGHEKAYKYNVKTNVPTELGGYEDLTITDVLDKRLDVVDSKVLVDGKVSDFEAKVDGQTVTLKLDRKQLDSIAGKEINLQITAKIKSGTDIEMIDNKATIQLNDNPDVDSNVVTVIPPAPTTPEVEKDVEGREHLEIIKGEEYNYNIKTNIPDNLGGYKSLVIKDVLDERLEVVGAKVFSDGEEVDFEVDIDGQTVTLTLDRKQLETVKGKELVVQITAKIIEDAPIELIDNKATIQLNDNPIVDSNVVTVIPPKPEEPMSETPEEQKPEEPKQPEQKQKVEVKPEEPVEKAPEKEEGKKLPKTASDMFNYLALGFALFLIGGVFYFVKRRAEQKE